MAYDWKSGGAIIVLLLIATYVLYRSRILSYYGFGACPCKCTMGYGCKCPGGCKCRGLLTCKPKSS